MHGYMSIYCVAKEMRENAKIFQLIKQTSSFQQSWILDAIISYSISLITFISFAYYSLPVWNFNSIFSFSATALIYLVVD